MPILYTTHRLHYSLRVKPGCDPALLKGACRPSIHRLVELQPGITGFEVFNELRLLYKNDSQRKALRHFQRSIWYLVEHGFLESYRRTVAHRPARIGPTFIEQAFREMR